MNIDDFVIRTPRLLLRPHRADDVHFMMDLNSDPEVTRYTPDGPLKDEKQARDIIVNLISQFEERRIGRFIVLETQTEARLGWCGLKWLEDVQEVDLGYRFLKSAWGHGYASEAARACLNYGFNTLSFSRVTARILPSNAASISVAQKLGLQKAGTVIEDDQELLVFEIRAENFKG
jgi:ribosomal-protein-alanine N-acetyltransferase